MLLIILWSKSRNLFFTRQRPRWPRRDVFVCDFFRIRVFAKLLLFHYFLVSFSSFIGEMSSFIMFLSFDYACRFAAQPFSPKQISSFLERSEFEFESPSKGQIGFILKHPMNNWQRGMGNCGSGWYHATFLLTQLDSFLIFAQT